MTKYNFYAGPAILPKEVMAKASQSALEFGGTGLSILEMSHRSKEVASVLEEAKGSVHELLGTSADEYDVLFLQGGASSQFFMTAMNFLGENESAGYVDTGAWSTKAFKEATKFGNASIIASSKDTNFNYIPKGFDIDGASKYVHLTSNNTIFGTQFQSFPDTNVPFICDMSSEIFSRKLDMSKFGMIYAGAQKNLGPAGVTLAILNKEFAAKTAREVPTMLDYQTHVKKDSAFNTPPVFAIYVSMLTMRWIKKNGGVEAMQAKNEHKAGLLYDEIDRNSLFHGTAAKEDRSLMNVCFLLHDESLTDDFLNACADANCIGVKGHRSVGGFRASIYNAMPTEGVQKLVDVMKQFESVNA
jgi:phosphoserine aminotransferase